MSKQSALEHQLKGSQAALSEALAELADLKEVQATMSSVVRIVRPYMREEENVLMTIQRIISGWQVDKGGSDASPKL